MTQPFRNPEGGLIDRAQVLPFSFDGHTYHGHAGDTLASALLANGVRLVGRSFKYHRPRGIVAAGVEEPNALVRLGRGARAEPNIRATQAELFAGLEATSQNRWPSLRFDLGGIVGVLAPMFPAGFYYKTFKWPSAWLRYEPFIRRAAGLGRAPDRPDPDQYEKVYAFADVLVAGGGPAGLAAALAAGRMGARVVLADDRPALGGSLLWSGGEIEGRPALEWVRAAEAELAAMPEATILRRTTAFAYYDHNMVVLAERLTDHLPAPSEGTPRQRLWRVRARQVVLATGALERPIPFADNDRPGVMLASAAQAYANQYAVRAGRRAVVFTNNDSAYGAARDLAAAGIEIVAMVDVRPTTCAVAPRGARHLTGHAVVRAFGGQALRSAEIAPLTAAERIGSPIERLDCDLVCVSGGGARASICTRRRAAGRPMIRRSRPSCPARPFSTSARPERPRAASRSRHASPRVSRPGRRQPWRPASLRATSGVRLWHRRSGSDADPALLGRAARRRQQGKALRRPPERRHGRGRRAGGARRLRPCRAAQALHDARHGHRSGPDQQRRGPRPARRAQGREIAAVGTTTFRPPFAPVTVGAFAGRAVGPHSSPVRRTAIHGRHEQAGARFVDAGLWKRPAWYARRG